MIGLSEDGVNPPVSHAAKLTARIFSEGGWLMDLPGVEHRAEQERLARRIAGAMEGDTSLLCEAGTGVGKSLAYLLPGIIHAVDTGRQMVVSTHTKTLQEQIRDKDLVKCRQLFGGTAALATYSNFSSAVLMGKGNYLCTTRLARAQADKQELFATPMQAELARVAQWAMETKTGLLTELQPRLSEEVWEAVSADSEACSRKHCTDGRCFYRRAKAACDAAQVLIVNHSLLFTLMALQGATGQSPARGILRLDDFAVLDEAHTVPDIATDHLGLSLSHTGLRRLLQSLHHPTRQRGLLRKHKAHTAQLAVEDALETAEHFFGFLQERVLQTASITRVRAPDVAEAMLEAPLNRLLSELDRLATSLDEGADKDELEGKARRVSAYRQGVTSWLAQTQEGDVHWLEVSGRKMRNIHLRSAPLDVSVELRRRLFERETSVTLTSATLATGSTLEPFRERVGAESVDSLIEKSPFDYERNLRVYVAADVPEPSGAESRLNLETLADYIGYCTLRVPGGSLVLFTSYRDLSTVAAMLEPEYRAAGRLCLIQEAGVSRSALAEQLRTAGNAVLFGTESFWTGIDVPGPSLSQVIITRLPFSPPSHPVAQARSEWVQARGGNAFAQLALPEALGQFRQGVGRLIRSKSDCGVVTILDPRLLTKAYGREFVASLPKPEIERLTKENRSEVFRPFPVVGRKSV